MSVTDYDELGRVRLTRQLRDAPGESVDDDTTGIKVQTRYLVGSGASYRLVSSRYTEASSGAAAGDSWSAGHRLD